MTGEVLTRQNYRKFIPVLARGSWVESAASWLSGKRYIDLSTASRYAAGHEELRKTICGTSAQPPPLGPPPPGYTPPAHRQPAVNLELFDRCLVIHDAAMRLIAYVVAKGTCTQEVLDQFSKDTKDARFLFNEDVEGCLRTLSTQALWVRLGQQKQEGLAYAPKSEEFQEGVDAWRDRLIWFTEQPNEVRKRFDPFLQIHE